MQKEQKERRKLLDLSCETVKKINILAAYNDTNFKNYCERVLEEHAENEFPNY